MHLSSEISSRINGNGSGNGHAAGASLADPWPQGSDLEAENDGSDLTQAESRIEALRTLAMVFLREVESLKKAVGPPRRRTSEAIDLDREMEEFEASLIRDALLKSHGNQRDAARMLNVKPTTLHAKMKRLGIIIETTVSGID